MSEKKVEKNIEILEKQKLEKKCFTHYQMRIDALMDDDVREMAMINYPVSIYYVAVDRCNRASLAGP